MKTLVTTGAFLCLAAAVCAAWAGDSPGPSAKAAMDKPIANFKLRDLAHDLKNNEKEADAMVSLESYRGKKNVILFFMSETCQVTWRYEKRVGKLLQAIAKDKKDVVFLAVRCSANDTPESIRKFAEHRNFDMPILNDEKGELTSFFGVHNTPSFALVDKKGMLRYKGGFDDNADEAAVHANYLPDAIDAVRAGGEVKVKETRALG